MKNMTLSNLAAACKGEYHGTLQDQEKVIADITTDSRKAGKDSLFVAIKGERVDAHRFIPAVYQQGALCVICEQAPESTERPYILVPSSLQAVKDIAEFYRQQLDIRVVGITGSVGKTSTKEMIASVLSEKYKVLKTQGNFNNELGLPLTVFRLREEDEIAVLEMGISDFGEMHRLSKVARPDICVITNIGQCHLEFLGDRDGVLKAKSEIFDYMAENGQVILNGDDDKLASIDRVKGIEPIFFGLESGRQIYADQIRSLGLKGIACCIHTGKGTFEVTIPIPGHHMVYNALAGTAVGLALDMTLEEIRRGIEKLESLSGRFHIMETERYTVIDDCYNANPVSMKASLQILHEAAGRRVAVLGDMGELGENEVQLHEEVGREAAKQELQLLICVGELSDAMAQAAKEQNPDLEVWHAGTLDDAEVILQQLLKDGDTILVKASHFMHFDTIVKALTEK